MDYKTKIKNLINSRMFPMILFVIIEGIMIFLVDPIYRDDAYFSTVLNNGESLFQIINFRYSTWSSRSIIEIVLILVASKPTIVWKTMHIFMMWLMAYSISSLLVKKENKKLGNYIICALLLTYPAFNYSTAGWEATTINYIWPISLGIYSFISIKKIFNDDKINVLEYITYALAIVFACNMEQMCFIILGVYIVYFIAFYMEKKKISKFMLLQIIISILSLIFIFTCKGNYIRQQSEVNKYMEYGTLNIFDKLSLCVTSTFNDMINWNVFPMTIFVIVLPIYVFSQFDGKLYRTMSVIPALILIPIIYCNNLLISIFPYLSGVREVLAQRNTLINVENVDDMQIWGIFIITLFFFVSLFMTLFLVSVEKKNYKFILIFCLGIMSKFMVAFTSTIFASAPRTIMYLEYCLYLIIIMLLEDLSNNNQKLLGRMQFGINILAFYQLINNIFFIVGDYMKG